MKQPIKVVMLPTKDISNIYKHNILNEIMFTDDKILNENNHDSHEEYHKIAIKTCTPQHVYITVSQDVEPIKVGDWVIEKVEIDKSETAHLHPQIPEGNYLVKIKTKLCIYEKQKKIIATNDLKIKSGICGNCSYKCYGKFLDCESMFPQLSQSFLKEYVTNPDDKFEVEYLNIFEHPVPYRSSVRPKLNKDNTISITSALQDKDWKTIANKLAKVAVEARDMLPYITMTTAKLHHLDLTLADRIEEALKPWLIKENL
jgi:hypothetical protein